MFARDFMRFIYRDLHIFWIAFPGMEDPVNSLTRNCIACSRLLDPILAVDCLEELRQATLDGIVFLLTVETELSFNFSNFPLFLLLPSTSIFF